MFLVLRPELARVLVLVYSTCQDSTMGAHLHEKTSWQHSFCWHCRNIQANLQDKARNWPIKFNKRGKYVPKRPSTYNSLYNSCLFFWFLGLWSIRSQHATTWETRIDTELLRCFNAWDDFCRSWGNARPRGSARFPPNLGRSSIRAAACHRNKWMIKYRMIFVDSNLKWLKACSQTLNELSTTLIRPQSKPGQEETANKSWKHILVPEKRIQGKQSRQKILCLFVGRKHLFCLT